MKRLLLVLSLLPVALSAAPQWIWSGKTAADKEKATFRKTFSVACDLKSATLSVVCDNGATAFLNGKQVLDNPDWQETSKADVKAVLKAGENELRFDAPFTPEKVLMNIYFDNAESKTTG